MIKFLATMFKGSHASKIGLSDQIKYDLLGLYESNPGPDRPGCPPTGHHGAKGQEQSTNCKFMIRYHEPDRKILGTAYLLRVNYCRRVRAT